MRSDLLVALPTYNERCNVAGLASRIRALPLTADLLFVDDDSPDGTGAELDRLAGQMPGVHVIHRPFRQGIGSAHQTAIRYAAQKGYSYLVTMDADGTHAPEDIPRLMETTGAAGVIVGSRFAAGAMDARDRLEVFRSRMVHVLTMHICSLPYDMTSAFRLYRLAAIKPGLISQCRANGYAFFPESLYRFYQHGISVQEVPIRLYRRQEGESKTSWSEALSWLVTLLWLKWRFR